MFALTVVIPIRNRWGELQACLDAVLQQRESPQYEIVIVDDGSEEPPPEWLRQTISGCGVPIRMKRQAPLGIPAARNRGTSLAEGDLILFLDSDSVPTAFSFASLAECAATYPKDTAFQFRIGSRLETWVGRMDDLFITAVQNAASTKDGHILYADGAGLAIRRSYSVQDGTWFNPSAVRGSDTLLLAELLKQGKLPRFVPTAMVYHDHRQSLFPYLLRHITIGYRSARADTLARVRVTSERKGKTLRRDILRELVIHSRRRRWGYSAFALVLIAGCLKLAGRIGHSVVGVKPGRHKVLNSSVDGLSSAELISRLIQAGERKRSLIATYLNSWSLIRAERDPAFRESVTNFDLCFADGIGVVYALFLTRGIRLKKVTANDFHFVLFQEAANRNLNIAFVGSAEGVAEAVARRTRLAVPDLKVVLCSSGYLSAKDEQNLVHELKRRDVRIVLVGRGQPLQELWVQRIRKVLPDTALLCVGGLFDYLSGRVKPTPVWMRRFGFEWLHRLVHHPLRYGYRYLFGGPLLFWYLVKHQVLRIIGSPSE
jgi:N-acetylglucosaminyldiphosphoundecaprenol N-acetyl-beta-D-mannosaminyltransferase